MIKFIKYFLEVSQPSSPPDSWKISQCKHPFFLNINRRNVEDKKIALLSQKSENFCN